MARGVREGLQRVLRGAVDTPAGVGLVPGYGRHAHEVAPVARPHAGEEGAGEQDGARHVGLNHRHDVLGVTLVHPVGPQSQSRVIDDDVHGAELLRQLIGQEHHCIPVPGIEHDHVDGRAEHRDDLVAQSDETLLSPSHDHDLASCLRKPQRACLPDPEGSRREGGDASHCEHRTPSQSAVSQSARAELTQMKPR